MTTNRNKMPKRLLGISQSAPEGFEYLAMVDNGWGRSPNLLDAVQCACSQGLHSTPAKGTLLIYLVAPGTYVNGMGSTIHQQGQTEPIEIFIEVADGADPSHNLRLNSNYIEAAIERVKIAAKEKD